VYVGNVYAYSYACNVCLQTYKKKQFELYACVIHYITVRDEQAASIRKKV